MVKARIIFCIIESRKIMIPNSAGLSVFCQLSSKTSGRETTKDYVGLWKKKEFITISPI